MATGQIRSIGMEVVCNDMHKCDVNMVLRRKHECNRRLLLLSLQICHSEGQVFMVG
jgi:hypothetical protein